MTEADSPASNLPLGFVAAMRVQRVLSLQTSPALATLRERERARGRVRAREWREGECARESGSESECERVGEYKRTVCCS